MDGRLDKYMPGWWIAWRGRLSPLLHPVFVPLNPHLNLSTSSHSITHTSSQPQPTLTLKFPAHTLTHIPPHTLTYSISDFRPHLHSHPTSIMSNHTLTNIPIHTTMAGFTLIPYLGRKYGHYQSTHILIDPGLIYTRKVTIKRRAGDSSDVCQETDFPERKTEMVCFIN